MHIALVHMRHADTGGTERYMNQLARFLCENGHRVTIVCRRHGAQPHENVRFEVLHDLALGSAWRMWAFARAVERHVRTADYDVVYGLGKTWTHDVIRLGGGCHATYLEQAHDAAIAPLERASGVTHLKHSAALRIERRALRSDAYEIVVTNSRMVLRDVCARHGVPEERVRVVYNGVDLELFHPRKRCEEGEALRRELGLAPEAPVVLFLGTGYGRKGLGEVLDAFPAVASENRAAHLIVVGFDSAEPRYQARARGLGLDGRIHLLGGRNDPETCFSASDVYVLPTRYDPFANSTLEALASGLPVITTRANGAAELLSPDEGAVLDPGWSTQDLAAQVLHWLSPENRRRGGEAARRLAETHGQDVTARESLAVLEEVAAAKGSRRAAGKATIVRR